MAALRELAESLGATDVSTYIASGNLLCTPPGESEAFDRLLQSAIETRFGFERDVVSRSRDEVIAALGAHPFEVAAPTSSFISFLTGTPAPVSIARASEISTGKDSWQVIGRDLHLRYALSAGRPEMNITAIGRALGVAGTARNLLTVQKLIDLTA